MNKRTSALIVMLVMGLLIIAIFLGFLSGISNPVPWILIAVLVTIPLVYRRMPREDRLSWKESYSVGVKMLDDDHKKLIKLLNQFQTAYDYHTGEAFERTALDELVDYTKYHFEREEGLMQELGYPDFAAHKAQHESMIREVSGFVQAYEMDGHEALDGVVNYLKGWLINHINGTDKQYGPFMNGKGIS